MRPFLALFKDTRLMDTDSSSSLCTREVEGGRDPYLGLVTEQLLGHAFSDLLERFVPESPLSLSVSTLPLAERVATC